MNTHEKKYYKFTFEEDTRLIEGFKLYGDDWDKLAAHVGSKKYCGKDVKKRM